jgi:outer membrane murein-binding lipoprotein Lpp
MNRLLIACMTTGMLSTSGLAHAQTLNADAAGLVAEMQGMLASVEAARSDATSGDDDATLYVCLTEAFINMGSYLLVAEEAQAALGSSGDPVVAEGSMELINTAHSRVVVLSVEAQQCESGVASFTGDQARSVAVDSRIPTAEVTQTGDLSSPISGSGSDDRDLRGTPWN